MLEGNVNLNNCFIYLGMLNAKLNTHINYLVEGTTLRSIFFFSIVMCTFDWHITKRIEQAQNRYVVELKICCNPLSWAAYIGHKSR